MLNAEELNRRITEMAKEDRKQKMQQDIFKGEDGPDSLESCLQEIDAKATEVRNNTEERISLPSSLLTNLIHQTKSTLAKIRQVNQYSLDKIGDLESKKFLEKTVNQEIKTIDSILNQFLNYISISTPVIKTNTILTILEEILEAKEAELYHKGIQITKKYEKDLPESCIHDEQIKYILNSILQYAVLSSSHDAKIVLLTRTRNIQKNKHNEKVIPMTEGDKTHIEIVFVVTEGREISRKSKDKGAETNDIILLLVKALVEKSQGLIEFEKVEKESMTMIGVWFPICRNRVVAHESIKI